MTLNGFTKDAVPGIDRITKEMYEDKTGD